MIGLYIALIIIALIGLIMLLPITAAILFAAKSEENEIIIRYLFFKLKIFPPKPKEEKAEEKKEDKKEKDEKEKKDKKGFADTVKKSWPEIRWGISKLLYYVIRHAITISELNVSTRFGFDNPMTTGLLNGAANGYIYNIISILDRHARLKKWNVDIEPNFNEPCMDAGVYCRLRTRIAHAFPIAAILLIMFIKIKIKMKNNGGKKNEQSN